MSPHPQDLPERSVSALIIDRHEATRIGLGQLLRRQPWVDRCFLAADGGHAVALAAQHRPDVALLDISNLGPFIAASTSALREAHPALKIVLVSRCAGELAASPRQLGAVAFLPPQTTSQEMLGAVRAAVLSSATPERNEPPLPFLTPRERELLMLLSTGATNREIAAALHRGPDSVKKSASALYRKLGVRNRTEAAQRAVQLLSPDG